MPLQRAGPESIQREDRIPQDNVLTISDVSGGLDTLTPLPILPNAFCRTTDGVVFTDGVIQTDIDCIPIRIGDSGLHSIPGDYHVLIPLETLAEGPTQLVLTTSGLYSIDQNGDHTEIHSGLNGDAEIRPSFAYMPSNDWLIITNGVDTPFYYDGSTVASLDTLNDAFTSFTARHVLGWNNLLFFIDTTENGTRRNYRVRRSDIADPTEWETGLAGFTDLLDTRDFVVGARVLGPYLIIYRENSLIRGEWVGQIHLLLDFNTVVPIDGPLNAEAIAQIDSTHIFAGEHGVYGYNGTLDVEHISYPISAPEEYATALAGVGKAAVRVFTGAERRVVTVMFPQAEAAAEGAQGEEGVGGAQGPTPLTETSVGPGTEAGPGQCRLDDGTLYDLLVGECWLPIIIRNDTPPPGVVYKQGRPEIAIETARGDPFPPEFCESLQGRHSGSPGVGPIDTPLGYAKLDDGTFYKLGINECYILAERRAALQQDITDGNFLGNFLRAHPEIVRYQEGEACPPFSRGQFGETIRDEYVPPTPAAPPTPGKTTLYGVHIPKTNRLPVTWHKRVFYDEEFNDVGGYITVVGGTAWNELVGTWQDQGILTWDDYRPVVDREREDILVSEVAGTTCAYRMRSPSDAGNRGHTNWSCETGLFTSYSRDMRVKGFFMQYQSSRNILVEFLDSEIPNLPIPYSLEETIIYKLFDRAATTFRIRFSGTQHAKIIMYGLIFAEPFDRQVTAGA